MTEPTPTERTRKIAALIDGELDAETFLDDLQSWQDLTSDEHKCLLYCVGLKRVDFSIPIAQWLIDNLSCNDARRALSDIYVKLNDYDRAISLAETVVRTARNPSEKLAGQHHLLAALVHLGAIPRYAARARFEYVGLRLMVERAIVDGISSEALGIAPWWAGYCSGKVEDRAWMEAAVRVAVQ